jgi:hypothetical protein
LVALFHCPRKFQISASVAISSMHMLTRRPAAMMGYR